MTEYECEIEIVNLKMKHQRELLAKDKLIAGLEHELRRAATELEFIRTCLQFHERKEREAIETGKSL